MGRPGYRRIILTTPPRHGKSELVSHWFPVWYFDTFPGNRIILTSYGAEFAASWGRRVRDTIVEHSELNVRVSPNSRSGHAWMTDLGGSMLTAGVGGPITGRGANLFLIDDPVKDREEAQSEVYRERNWEWWRQTARTRLEPNASVVVIQTRWHEGDLAGKLIEDGGWRVINYPAIAEEDDALGRAPGEALWPERYTIEDLAEIRRDVGPYAWSALYQQRPTPAEGGLFKREWFRYFHEDGEGPDRILTAPDGSRHALSSLTRFGTVDLATSIQQDADFTVICSWASNQKYLWLLDVVRERMEGPDILPAVSRSIARFGLGLVWIEKAGFQLSLIQMARRRGMPVREIIPDKDKMTRALFSTPYMEQTRVLFPAHAHWLDKFEHELLSAPNGEYWDQIDAFAYGVFAWMKFGAGGLLASPPGFRDETQVLRLRDPDAYADDDEDERTDAYRPPREPDRYRSAFRASKLRRPPRP